MTGVSGPYIKPTVFSGDWVILRYDQTPINYYTLLSGNYTSSVADSKILYYPSSTQQSTYNTNTYSFDRKRLFLESSEGLLPGPINENRVSELIPSMFAASSEDIIYNSNFYELFSSSSVIKVEVAKRVPHVFSLQFSSVNNSRYIPLIIRPPGCSFGFNIKIFENAFVGLPDNGKNTISAVTGVHFHNPTYDSYMSPSTLGVLPEDSAFGLGLPMYSKVDMLNSSSMIFYGAERPFDFVSTSGEGYNTFWSEKGAPSLADGAFYHGFIMVQNFHFNWSGIEGVHKIKQYNYISEDLSGYYTGQHRIQLGIDWYFTNTFNNGYFYRPDFAAGSEPAGAPGASSLYDLNSYKYTPSVTGTSLFGNVEDKEYTNLFSSGIVFNAEFNSASSTTNNPGDPVGFYGTNQGILHNIFHYDFKGIPGNIFVDQGKKMTSTDHPYFSALFPYTTQPVLASGWYNGWNSDPNSISYPGPYNTFMKQSKNYVCPIMELKSPNPFNTTDKVCVGVYTKLTGKPDCTDHRPNNIAVGNRREQIVSVWKKDRYYRPFTPETVPTPYAEPPPGGGTYPDFGPFTLEDVNGGGYMNIYQISNKDIKRGWYAIEYWMIIAETKEQVISKINLLHSMGVSEANPGIPEIELPKAIYDSVLASPVRGTL